MTAVSQEDAQKRRNKLYSIVAGKYGITKFDLYDKQEKAIKNGLPVTEKFFNYTDPVLKEKLFNYSDSQLREGFNYTDPVLKEKLFNYTDPVLKEKYGPYCPYCQRSYGGCPNACVCARRRRREMLINSVMFVTAVILGFVIINAIRKK
jgi:hypothetical protein